jgi:hypothetical protein
MTHGCAVIVDKMPQNWANLYQENINSKSLKNNLDR